jgi:hypothetical protein
MFKELAPRETSAIDLRIVENDRRFLRSMDPIVKRYKEGSVTSKSINNLGKGIYGVIEEISGFKYTFRRCPRLTQEEITRIDEKDKMVLLLAPEIFTREGLAGLCKVFPLSMGWTTDPKDILNITHNPKRGGCVVTEKGLEAPFTTRSEYELRDNIKMGLYNISIRHNNKELIEKIKGQVGDLYKTPTGGYSEEELIKKAKSEGGFGLGIPHYMIASKLSQIITGVPLDVNTFVRIPGSSHNGEPLVIGTNSYGHFHVFKSPKSSQVLGIRSGLMIEKDNSIWQSFIRPDKPFEQVKIPYNIA